MVSRGSAILIHFFRGEFRVWSVMTFYSTISQGKGLVRESFTNPQVAVTNYKLINPFFCHSRNRMCYVNGPNFRVLSLVSVVASLFEGFDFETK